jgi:hypothetical protein
MFSQRVMSFFLALALAFGFPLTIAFLATFFFAFFFAMVRFSVGFQSLFSQGRG